MQVWEALLNLFSKYIFLLALLIIIFPQISKSITIYGLYTSSCERELGIIIDVNKKNVTFISLKGELKKIIRHKLIYVTAYSIDTLSLLKIKNMDKTHLIHIKAFQNKKFVTLAKGWPIDYSNDTISFLNTKGYEIIVARNNIWEITKEKSPSTFTFKNPKKISYVFNHPYPFNQCQSEQYTVIKNTKVIKLNPHTLLHSPIKIKFELDRLQKDKKKVSRYISWQQFYHVPHIYKNATSLGYWFSINGRYGSSKERPSNLSPILQNEVSTGPFGYQHIFFTGSGPMPYAVHEEPQTQVYYRMKIDYVHLALMLDPNRFLLPEHKYNWQSSELKKFDDRLHQEAGGEFGFDYGFFTLQAHISSVPFGIRMNEFHYSNQLLSVRPGITFQNHIFSIELQYALPYESKKTTESDFMHIERPIAQVYYNTIMDVYRLNVSFKYFKNLTLFYSLIYRTLYFETNYNIDGMVFNSIENEQSFIDLYMSDLNNPESNYTEEYLNEQINRIRERIEALKQGFELVKTQIHKYKSTSVTNSLYGTYQYNYKYSFGSFCSIEYHEYIYEGY